VCRKLNNAISIEETEEGVITRFLCECGNNHGIVHAGEKSKAVYLLFLETEKKRRENTPAPSVEMA